MMNEKFPSASPKMTARVAGTFYLLTTITAPFALFVRGKLVVSGDAAATAAHIMAHQAVYRMGFYPIS